MVLDGYTYKPERNATDLWSNWKTLSANSWPLLSYTPTAPKAYYHLHYIYTRNALR